MTPHLLLPVVAAALFSSEARVPLPSALRVAIAQGKLIAATSDGKGTVFTRDETGRLRPGSSFDAGRSPASIAVADLNGDGEPDLVIANHEEKHVTVLFGPGYARGSQIAVEVTPHTHFAAVADLDGDGKPDLVLNDMGGRRILVLWGDGDGTFSSAATVATGSRGYAYINVAVVGREVFVPSWPQPQIAVLRAGPGRHLLQTSLLELRNPAFFVAAADFGGDGKPDLAVATYSGNAGDLSRDGVVLFSQGRGPPKAYAAGPGPTSLATGDIDGDGLADLAVCDQGGESVSLLLGGKEGLRPASKVQVGAKPVGIALGDLDGDGKADLAVAAGDAVYLFLTARKGAAR